MADNEERRKSMLKDVDFAEGLLNEARRNTYSYEAFSRKIYSAVSFLKNTSYYKSVIHPHPLLKKMLEWCCFALTISSIFFAFLFAIAAMAVFVNALRDGQGIQKIIIPTLVSILFGLLAAVFWSFRQHISEEV